MVLQLAKSPSHEKLVAFFPTAQCHACCPECEGLFYGFDRRAAETKAPPQGACQMGLSQDEKLAFSPT